MNPGHQSSKKPKRGKEIQVDKDGQESVKAFVSDENNPELGFLRRMKKEKK